MREVGDKGKRRRVGKDVGLGWWSKEGWGIAQIILFSLHIAYIHTDQCSVCLQIFQNGNLHKIDRSKFILKYYLCFQCILKYRFSQTKLFGIKELVWSQLVRAPQFTFFIENIIYSRILCNYAFYLTPCKSLQWFVWKYPPVSNTYALVQFNIQFR